jgi:hypothetical protein
MLILRNLGRAMWTICLTVASAAFAAPAPGPATTAVHVVPSTVSQAKEHVQAPGTVPADRKPLDGVLVAPDCSSVTCRGGRTGTSTGARERTLVAPSCTKGGCMSPVAYIGETEKNLTGGTPPIRG